MISFKSFINAIHDAIMSANEELMERNVGLLDKYFENTTSEDELQSSLNEALRASKEISGKKGSVTREDFKSAGDAIEKAIKALSQDKNNEEGSEDARVPGTLSPKSVVMEFPQQTPDGIKFTEVHVPLITLVPLTMSQIEKATLTADIDLEIIDGELQLNFSDSRRIFGKKSRATRGRLEVVISPHESSEGLRKIVEGYENILKAQMPH